MCGIACNSLPYLCWGDKKKSRCRLFSDSRPPTSTPLPLPSLLLRVSSLPDVEELRKMKDGADGGEEEELDGSMEEEEEEEEEKKKSGRLIFVI